MSPISNKLFRLSALLDERSLFAESLAINRIIKFSSNETFIMNDGGEDSTAVAPVSARNVGLIGPSQHMDRLLKDIGATPIRYMGGRSAQYLTDRDLVRSKWGDLYEVLFDGKVSVAKIIRLGDKENVIWDRIANASFEPEVMRHIPVIRAIENVGDYNVIVMEKLGRLSSHMKRVFRADRAHRGTADILKNEDFIHDMVSRSVYDALVSVSEASTFEDGDEETNDLVAKYLNSISNSHSKIVSRIESDIFSNSFDLYDPITFQAELPEAIILYLQQDVDLNPAENWGHLGTYGTGVMAEEFAVEIGKNIESYITSPTRAIPKYYLSTGATREMDPNEETYEGTPEGFLYTQEYMPETKNLFNAMIKLKEANIIWQDLHLNNLMQRIESNDHGEPGDLVVIDVGLYGTEEENRAM